jgi:hypothetical protein
VFLVSPKSCTNLWRSGVGFGGVDPRVVVHPESPGLTGLTGAEPSWVLLR